MPTPEFILSLREKIGHDPLWMPGVTAVVFNEGGQVLLCRRSDNGAWTPITGIVDPGEEPAVTAVLGKDRSQRSERNPGGVLRYEKPPRAPARAQIPLLPSGPGGVFQDDATRGARTSLAQPM